MARRDGAGLGAGQLGPYRQPGLGQGVDDAAGEPVWPAVPARAGEGLQFLAGSGGQGTGGGPALQQLEEHRRAQVAVGDVDRGGEDGQQVGAQPVADPPLVAGGPLVIAGDRAQLGADLAVRDQLAQLQVAVQGEQAADPGVLGVVFLLRRTAAPRHQVRVHRQHREPRVGQRLHQQPMPGLQHHPHLSRIGLQLQAAGHQPGHPSRAVLDPELLDHPLHRACR